MRDTAFPGALNARLVRSAVVIGVDALVGAGLFAQLRADGWPAVGTSRRAPRAGTVPFDLGDAPEALLDHEAVRALRYRRQWAAFLAAGITGYSACASDPDATRRTNVTNSVAVAEALVGSGGFVVYPSTTAVFHDDVEPHDETSVPSPLTEYGRQKLDAETALLLLNGCSRPPAGVAVVRLTKVVALTGVVGEWVATLRSGGAIDAATDLLLSPVSARYVGRGLMTVAESGRGGVYHLAGECHTSYYEFALALADALGASAARVRPVELVSATRSTWPAAAALRMPHTTAQLGLAPQPLVSVLRDLLSSPKL